MQKDIVLHRRICSLPGGTQSCVVEDTAGRLYTLKVALNPQGPNVLANEWLGSQVMAILRLRTPTLHQVVVPDSFLEVGSRSCLGLLAEFIEGRDDRICYELLPRGCLSRVINLSDLIGTFVLDVWAGSTDRRQALYVAGPDHWYKAVFIDNGQLFGGPNWAFRGIPGCCFAPQHWLYAGLLEPKRYQQWVTAINKDVIPRLPALLRSLPYAWYSGNTSELLATLLNRARQLKSLLRLEEQWSSRNDPDPRHLSRFELEGITAFRPS